MQTIKLVVFGDGGVGKTSIVKTYTKNYSPDENMCICKSAWRYKRPIKLEICDSAGEEDYERLKSFSYLDTNVFMFCFSIVDPDSLESLKVKWYPRVRFFCPNASIILVGTKLDLRKSKEHIDKLKKFKQSPVKFVDGKQFAQAIGALNYLECCALMNEDVDDIFNESIQKYLKSGKSETFIRQRTDYGGQRIPEDSESEDSE